MAIYLPVHVCFHIAITIISSSNEMYRSSGMFAVQYQQISITKESNANEYTFRRNLLV